MRRHVGIGLFIGVLTLSLLLAPGVLGPRHGFLFLISTAAVFAFSPPYVLLGDTGLIAHPWFLPIAIGCNGLLYAAIGAYVAWRRKTGGMQPWVVVFTAWLGWVVVLLARG